MVDCKDGTPQQAKYSVFDEKIPNDRYELTSIVQNDQGTVITLEGDRFKLTVTFGFTEAVCVCDEGRRIKSYNTIGDIQQYRKNKFLGNPLFAVTGNSDFTEWLKTESCGFSFGDTHYAIITLNDFIDITSAFPPTTSTEKIE